MGHQMADDLGSWIGLAASKAGLSANQTRTGDPMAVSRALSMRKETGCRDDSVEWRYSDADWDTRLEQRYLWDSSLVLSLELS